MPRIAHRTIDYDEAFSASHDNKPVYIKPAAGDYPLMFFRLKERNRNAFDNYICEIQLGEKSGKFHIDDLLTAINLM